MNTEKKKVDRLVFLWKFGKSRFFVILHLAILLYLLGISTKFNSNLILIATKLSCIWKKYIKRRGSGLEFTRKILIAVSINNFLRIKYILVSLPVCQIST